MQEHICPYCNGLDTLIMLCPACGAPMEDGGTLQEALGPYSPHEENSLVHGQYGCVHQVVCRICTVDYLFTVLP